MLNNNGELNSNATDDGNGEDPVESEASVNDDDEDMDDQGETVDKHEQTIESDEQNDELFENPSDQSDQREAETVNTDGNAETAVESDPALIAQQTTMNATVPSQSAATTSTANGTIESNVLTVAPGLKQCFRCNKAFVNESMLCKHLKKKHGINTIDRSTMKNEKRAGRYVMNPMKRSREVAGNGRDKNEPEQKENARTPRKFMKMIAKKFKNE